MDVWEGTLPETNSKKAPENGGFPTGISEIPGGPLFSGALAVKLREGKRLVKIGIWK